MNDDRYQGWPWLPFVDLSLVAAIGPGFLMGGLMLYGSLFTDPGAWYIAAAQAHGHAQLVGWVGAMILGVILEFAPRIRGTTLAHPERIPFLFWLFAGGFTLRFGGQIFANAGEGEILPLIMAAGAWCEAAAIAGLLYELVTTLDNGPPLSEKPGFRQLQPFLATAGASLLTGLVIWAVNAGADGSTAPFIFNPLDDQTAVYLILFGCLVPISIAMSARLFPLFSRTKQPLHRLLSLSAYLFAAGSAGLVIRWFVSFTGATAPLLFAVTQIILGLAVTAGTAAVRVFEPRRQLPHKPFHLWQEPAALGHITAHFWAAIAGFSLILMGLRSIFMVQNAVPEWLTAIRLSPDFALHAAGAGFATVLILSVGPTLLPGFGRSRPGSPTPVWVMIILGHVAALLRTAPDWLSWLVDTVPRPTQLMAAGGVTGLAAAVILAWTLHHRWNTPTHVES